MSLVWKFELVSIPHFEKVRRTVIRVKLKIWLKIHWNLLFWGFTNQYHFKRMKPPLFSGNSTI